ncbi:MAG: HlyD family efflux transporter periplasmic adaptor subunit [Eubacteriales bacterium]|nr:HlyD family efflux transporter periplasmic adaptor subunit [Eubacteriales bacterium]
MAFKWSPFRRKKSRKRSNVWKIGKWKVNRTLRVPILAFALILIYSTFSFAVNHYNPVKTTPAAQISLDDSFSTTGYFIREEEVIEIPEGDTVEYNYSNGDKVTQGAALVTEYANEESLSASRELKNVEETIEQLNTLRSVSASTTNSSLLNQQIIEKINAICEEVESGSLNQLSSLSSELRKLALKSGSLSGDSDDIEGEIASLEEQADALQQRLDGNTTDVTSPRSGYFCESADGLEEVFTPDVIDDLTLSSLDQLAQSETSDSSGKGKIVYGYVWYFAARVSDSDAKRLTQGDTIQLRFSQVSQDIEATVTSIRDEEDSDDTLVIFQSQDMTEELISMRKQVATVIIDSYSGLRVPKSAVRMEGDEMGVYVLSNSVASYKTIEPLYEGDDFYIVEQNVTGNDSLVLNDDIIVEAKDVNDKKVMK